jgi:hypothetical protein
MTTSRNDVNTPVVALVGFLGSILVFAVIIGLLVLFYNVETQQAAEKDLNIVPAEISTLVNGQKAKLTEYRWVDQEKKITAIPISRAMELVASELAANPAAASPKVTAPAANPEAKPEVKSEPKSEATPASGTGTKKEPGRDGQ